MFIFTHNLVRCIFRTGIGWSCQRWNSEPISFVVHWCVVLLKIFRSAGYCWCAGISNWVKVYDALSKVGKVQCQRIMIGKSQKGINTSLIGTKLGLFELNARSICNRNLESYDFWNTHDTDAEQCASRNKSQSSWCEMLSLHIGLYYSHWPCFRSNVWGDDLSRICFVALQTRSTLCCLPRTALPTIWLTAYPTNAILSTFLPSLYTAALLAALLDGRILLSSWSRGSIILRKADIHDRWQAQSPLSIWADSICRQ